jgi:hypothetical protein
MVDLLTLQKQVLWNITYFILRDRVNGYYPRNGIKQYLHEIRKDYDIYLTFRDLRDRIDPIVEWT